MSDLKKIITRAVEGGWKLLEKFDEWYVSADGKVIVAEIRFDEAPPVTTLYYIDMIIFSHEFAKAYWGEELINPKPTGNLLLSMPPQTQYTYDTTWQYHLQKLALSTDRIKYLIEN